jgi:hypothetical protein
VLSEAEKTQVAYITSLLINYETILVNEPTIWARAIYPLLVLAEEGDIRAWVEVPLQARYPHLELKGIADGVLGKSAAGMVKTPYLVVVEAKRRTSGANPRFQPFLRQGMLYGELLAAARLNWEQTQKTEEEIWGCYTVADSWTFIRAIVEEIDSSEPKMTIESSREYVEKLEAETIFKIMKQIVSKCTDESMS